MARDMAPGSPSIPRSDPAHLSGMLLAAAAFALLTSVDTIFKLMAAGHPAYQILLINGAFAVMPIMAAAMLTGGLERLRTERPLLHLVRGSVSVMSAFCAIYAYSRLPLANFYAIVFTGPLMVTAMSAFWLREKVEKDRWLAIACGFAGVLVVMNPLGAVPDADAATAIAGRIAAFASVLCYAVSVVILRRMRLGESNLAFSFYGYVASTSIGAILLLSMGSGPDMHAMDFAHLALSGFLAGLSSICLMTAYHRSPVAVVAPFQYTQIFWGALAGWLLWQQVPDQHLIAGAAIVAASGLYVIFREMRAPPEKSAAATFTENG
jgi:drug/metabolite transporter (DMT)-like permease